MFIYCYSESNLKKGETAKLEQVGPRKFSLVFLGGEKVYPDDISHVIIHWTDYGNFAIVGVPDKKYLWILSRTESISKAKARDLMRIAEKLGYDIDKLWAEPSAVEGGEGHLADIALKYDV